MGTRWHRLSRTVPTLLALVAWAPTSALAWSDAGHKIIASIAFRQLSETEQQAVVAILKAHPRFEADLAKKMSEEIAKASDAEKNEWLFQQAAKKRWLFRPTRVSDVYAAVEEIARPSRLATATVCGVLEVNRSAFYAWRSSLPSPREERDTVLRPLVRASSGSIAAATGRGGSPGSWPISVSVAARDMWQRS